MKYLKLFDVFVNESLDESELNKILDKIKKSGMISLSNHEKTLLKSYSDKSINIEEEEEKQRKRQKGAMNVIKNHVTHLKVKKGEYIDLEDNIGRYIKFKWAENLKVGDEGWGYMGIFEIVGIQKHWGYDETGRYVPDRIGYRVSKVGYEEIYGREDFGYPCSVEDVIFVNMTEEEAININKEIYSIYKKQRYL